MAFPDEDEKEPDFSDVTSGSSSTAGAPAGETVTRTYTVVSGDANRWKEIWEANKDKIKNPDLIHPGQELKIPGA